MVKLRPHYLYDLARCHLLEEVHCLVHKFRDCLRGGSWHNHRLSKSLNS